MLLSFDLDRGYYYTVVSIFNVDFRRTLDYLREHSSWFRSPIKDEFVVQSYVLNMIGLLVVPRIFRVDA
jgi:hypothetical protein